jgi:hypothetical protein
MAITNHERVGKALELLKTGLGPFAEREFANTYQAKAVSQAALFLGDDRLLANKPMTQWDAAATGALKPWREVVTPHTDVASGRYQQAEFAADLW